jgi:hypothetical protein
MIIILSFIRTLLIEDPCFLVYSSESGEVRVIDTKTSSASLAVSTSQNMTTMAVHPNSNIFAWYVLSQGCLTFSEEDRLKFSIQSCDRLTE